MAVLGGLASVAAVAVRGIVRRALPLAAAGRPIAEKAAFILPLVCVVFWAISWIAYAAINDRVFHRDPGLGDSWFTPMPNGDVLAAIDIPDVGYIETSGQVQLVSDVTRLQVDPGWIAGSYDTAARGFRTARGDIDKGFFLLNVATNARQDFSTSDELASALGQRSLALHLRPFETVFHEYRNTWFDYATLTWALTVPFCAVVALAVYVRRLRRGWDETARGA